MQLIRCLLVSSLLIAPACLAAILIRTAEPESHSKLSDAAVKFSVINRYKINQKFSETITSTIFQIEIVASCYRNRGNALVLAGNAAGIISRRLWSRFYIPACLLDNSKIMASIEPVSRDSSHKLQIFVVTASSQKSLSSTLKDLKDSPWWNHMASVLILDWSVTISGCSKSFGMLRRAWSMNLLHAKFMCLDRTKRTLLYSYNPYTIRAPQPWKLVDNARTKEAHPWSLFAQRYLDGKRVCDQLDFEKTIDLGRHQIKARVNNISGVWSTKPDKNGTDSFDGLDGIIARFLFRALNVIPSVVTYNRTYNIIPKIRNNKTVVGGLVDLRNGIFDIGLNAWFPDINATMSRPFRQSKIAVMTQYRGHMSQLAKIAAVIDRPSRFGLLLVALITLMVFKCWRRQSLMQAFLNVWRIYCNSSIPKVPVSQALRIYLAGLYLLMINIQGIYQGKISALVTMPVPIPDVQTIQDIVSSGLTVYGDVIFSPDFDSRSGEVDFVELPGNLGNCTGQVMKDYLAACVHEKNILNHEAAKFKLHVSEEPILNFYQLYAIRPDWPLEERINAVLTRLVESGLVDHSDKIDIKETSRIRVLNENLRPDQTFKVMTLDELAFAFSILGSGLTLAAISFVVEIGIGPVGSRIASTMSYICNRLGLINR